VGAAVTAPLVQQLSLAVDERPFFQLPPARRAMWKKVVAVVEGHGGGSSDALEDAEAALAAAHTENAALRRRVYELEVLLGETDLQDDDVARRALWRRIFNLTAEWLEAADMHHRGRRKVGACPVCLMLRTNARELRNRLWLDRPVGKEWAYSRTPGAKEITDV